MVLECDRIPGIGIADLFVQIRQLFIKTVKQLSAKTGQLIAGITAPVYAPAFFSIFAQVSFRASVRL
jgi:hypothetical protein